MELIREIYEIDIKEISEEENVLYRLRKASRSIVFNDVGEIALLYVSKDDYHKLPGGGIEGRENIVEALDREVMEEVGVESEMLGEIGTIIEYRNKHELLQISYCFYSKAKGESKGTSFTESEIKNGFKLKWINFDKAISILENDKPKNYVGKFIKERDLTFLKKGKDLNILNKDIKK